MDVFSDESFDVPDSTDWLGTPLSGLMPVEQAFRCHVCKDFFNSPMLTSCNHTFCSLCIRRCLSVEGKCPLCRANDQESKLRGNWAMREAVDAFVKTRDEILRFAKTPPAPAASNSPKRKAEEMEEAPVEEVHESKRPRMSTRSSKAKGAEATAAIMRAEADLAENNRDTEESFEPNDGLVACPICWKRMKEVHINQHLDNSCPGVPQLQQQSSALSSRPIGGPGSSSIRTPFHQSSTTPPKPQPERLPTLAYSMLNDTALRKKLRELGISQYGTRTMLEQRHKEWITIWNANCDAARPKKRAELLHDLEVWEKTVGSRAPAMSRAANVGAQIKDKDFDGAAWASNHSTSFKDLIANARKTRNQAQQKAREAAEESDSAPASKSGSGAVASEPGPKPSAEAPISLSEEIAEPASTAATTTGISSRPGEGSQLAQQIPLHTPQPSQQQQQPPAPSRTYVDITEPPPSSQPTIPDIPPPASVLEQANVAMVPETSSWTGYDGSHKPYSYYDQ